MENTSNMQIVNINIMQGNHTIIKLTLNISHAKTIHDLQSTKYKPTKGKDWDQKELKRINFNNVMNTCLLLLNTKFSNGFREYFSDNGN